MKRIVSLFLILFTVMGCFLFTSCQSDDSNKPASGTTFKVTNDYVIVRPENATFAEISACKAICAAIKLTTGMELATVEDSTAERSHEIVIGNSRRSKSALAKNKAGGYGYSLFATEENVYIYGSSDALLTLAYNYFIESYIAPSSTLTLPRRLDVTYKDLFAKRDLKINGVDISEYKIVYDPTSPTTHYRNEHSGWVESSRFEDTARAVADIIYLLTEKRLEVISAADAEETDYEILVGRVADREEINQFYKTYGEIYADEKYGFGVVGTKLLFSGGSPNSAYFGARAFADTCAKMRGSNYTHSLVIGKKDLIKIACIGDGLTHGSSSSNVNEHCYPIYLQNLLGFEYYVANYGTPNKKMTDYDIKSKKETEENVTTEYERSISFVPDVIILMLGTNDANPSNSKWNEKEYKELYEKSAERLVTAYRRALSSAQVYIVAPPAIAKNDEWEENLTAVSEWTASIAETLKIEFIDVYGASKEHAWKFPDSLHPKNEQYKDLADVIYDSIKYTVRIK